MRIVLDASGELLRSTLPGGGVHLVKPSLGEMEFPAIPLELRSAVGAGDSFVAAMTYGLAAERSVVDAFQVGNASG